MVTASVIVCDETEAVGGRIPFSALEIDMFFVDVISRVLHVFVAIALLGGSVFTLFVLIPSAKKLEDASHKTLAESVQGYWKRFVHGGVALLLLTGLYNYVRAAAQHSGDSLYHALLGTKMILSLLVFFLAAALVGRSSKLQFIRDQRGKWLRIVVLLGVVIVAIAGFAKVRGVSAMPETGAESALLSE